MADGVFMTVRSSSAEDTLNQPQPHLLLFWLLGRKNNKLWTICMYCSQLHFVLYNSIMYNCSFIPFKAVNVWSWPLPNLSSAPAGSETWDILYFTTVLYQMVLTRMGSWCSEWHIGEKDGLLHSVCLKGTLMQILLQPFQLCQQLILMETHTHTQIMCVDYVQLYGIYGNVCQILLARN